MSQQFEFKYHLDKAYFSECFEQSDLPKPWLTRYAKGLMLMALGLLLLVFIPSEQTELSYAKYFVFALGVLEMVSTYYRQTLWVWRQQISKAANCEVTLIINEVGLHSTSIYGQNDILWSEIDTFTATTKGLVIEHAHGKTYLSNRFINADANAFIAAQCEVRR